VSAASDAAPTPAITQPTFGRYQSFQPRPGRLAHPPGEGRTGRYADGRGRPGRATAAGSKSAGVNDASALRPRPILPEMSAIRLRCLNIPSLENQSKRYRFDLTTGDQFASLAPTRLIWGRRRPMLVTNITERRVSAADRKCARRRAGRIDERGKMQPTAPSSGAIDRRSSGSPSALRPRGSLGRTNPPAASAPRLWQPRRRDG
jgi:hypothetical protein